MNIKISTIVPIFNAGKYLEQALDSLALQNVDAGMAEFLLINDGSTDNSLEIAKNYANDDERFKVFDRSNVGYGATLNFGISEACGEYVAVLEPDDWINPGMYSKMIEVADKDNLDIVRCNYKKVWTKAGFRAETIESTADNMIGKIFKPKVWTDCFFFHPAIWSMIASRKMIVDNKITLLETPGAAFQDTSYSFKLWACANRAICLKEAYVNYRQDNEKSSINNPNTSEYVHREYEEIAEFIAGQDDKEMLAKCMMRRQFLAYVWNYERLDKPLHLNFAKTASEDMRKLFNAGFFDENLYEPWEISDLKLLADSAEKFVHFKDSTPRILRKLKHMKDMLK